MLKGTGVVLGGLAVPGLLEACLSSSPSSSSGSIKIGYVSPITGPAAGFGEPDAYVLSLAKKAFQNGITIGGTNYSVEIVSRDGQSTPSVGSQVANDLIASQKVDLMLATDARDGQSCFGRVRGCGRSVHFDGRALGGVVSGPRRQARPAFAIQVHVPL